MIINKSLVPNVKINKTSLLVDANFLYGIYTFSFQNLAVICLRILSEYIYVCVCLCLCVCVCACVCVYIYIYIYMSSSSSFFFFFWGGGGGWERDIAQVERSLMVRWVVGSILHGVELLSYFSFQPVLHDWCNKGRGMCYPVCGMVHIK